MNNPPQSEVVELLGRIRHLLTDNGVDVLDADLNREYNALVVEHVASSDDRTEVLAEQLPWVAGMITGVLRDAGWPEYVDVVIGFAYDPTDDPQSGGATAIRWSVPRDLLARFSEEEVAEVEMHKGIIQTAAIVEPDGSAESLDVSVDVIK